jgi:hypothetical protein
MLISRVQKFSALLSFAFLAFFAASCAQPTGPAGAGDNSFGGVAIFTIPTPTAAGTISGSDIVLTWSNGGTTGSQAAGGEFYPTNTGGTDFAAAGNTLTAGSGHTDIYQLIAGVWTKIGESKTGTYTVTGIGDVEGEYSFYVKEKSLSGTGKTQNTWHSLVSNTVVVTVEVSCMETNTFDIAFGEQMNDNDNDHVRLTNPTEITSSAPSGKFNLHFTLDASCDEFVADTEPDENGDYDMPVVTFQIGNAAVVTAMWNGSKYIANNIECPRDENNDKIMGTHTFTITIGTQTLTGWTVICE